MVAWVVWHTDFEWYATIKDNTRSYLIGTPEFLVDLVSALGVRIGSSDQKSPFTLDKTKFYENSEGAN